MEQTFANDTLAFVREELHRIEPTLDTENLALDSDIADLGIESVTLLELVAALEDRHGIEIPDDELTTLSSLRDVVDLTERHVAAKR